MEMVNIEKALRELEGKGARRKAFLIGDTGSKTLNKISEVVRIGQQAHDLYETVRDRYRKATTWFVNVQETDALYRAAQDWLLHEIPEQDSKYITANTETIYVDAAGRPTEKNTLSIEDIFSSTKEASPSNYSETRVVRTMGDSTNFVLPIDGYKIEVTISYGEEGVSTNSDGSGRERPQRRIQKVGVNSGKITFKCRSVGARNAVMRKLESLVSGRNTRKPTLWIADSWGSWRSQDAPVRKLDTVVLADGLKEDILGDLRKFLADEQRYVDLGMPWHRGLVLHGPPGTGKTSLIKAISAELGLDLWYAPLGDIKEDSALLDLIRSVRSRGVLLLEDVDSYSAARDREDSGDGEGPKNGISTSALLNALDGIVTPHGLITIMTTNHYEKLDPALLRSGRADRVVELGLPTWGEVDAMYRLFFPEEFDGMGTEPDWFSHLGFSQADVAEIFKSNWDEPNVARKTLLEMCYA